MIVFILMLLVVLCSGLSIAPKNQFYKDYCYPENTNTINAFFSILIFLSHSVTYVNADGFLDIPYMGLRSFFGQAVVVTYLFFSGYGIMTSIKKKGLSYVKAMPVNRFFKLWYHFAIAILLYTVVSIVIAARRYSFSHWLLSFTGLTSIGNSNWYLFITFVLYIIVFFSFLVFRKSNKIALVCVWILSIAFLFLEKGFDLPGRYYNTLLCFPFGMVFSMVKPSIDKRLMKKDSIWLLSLALSVVAFVCFLLTRKNLVCYIFFTFFAVVIIVLIMMKVKVKSPALEWLGKHVFSFFILQRIPMILLRKFGCNDNVYFFVIISFLITIFLSVIFDKIIDKLDHVIFKKVKYNKNKLKV